MEQPGSSLKKLSNKLFSAEALKEEFLESFISPYQFASALVWLKDRPEKLPFEVLDKPKWMPEFIDLIGAKQKAGATDLHQEGYFYIMDPSSVFMGAPLFSLKDRAETVLDMCAAPGGKAILSYRTLTPEILICNEVIGKRLAALISNLKRCKVTGCNVISLDSARIALEMAGCFDLVIVDAPCSGQSLVARGERSPGCFNPATINMNSNRQKRIIANAAKVVAPGGYLLYMTCTFSRDENEGVAEWLQKKFSQFEAVEVHSLKEFNSHLSDLPCYRLWPMSKLGAGGFTVLLRNNEDTKKNYINERHISKYIRWSPGSV